MKSKKTFMFLYNDMDVGGIETYLIRLIRQLKKNGNRIIWLSPSERYIDNGFKKDFLDGYIEIIDIKTRGFYWLGPLSVRFGIGEEVVALAFNPIDFLRIETIKKQNSDTIIDSFFWVPHFKGSPCFIEERAIGLLQPIVRYIIGKIIKGMEKNDNIYYLNRSHLEAYSTRYGYYVEKPENKINTGTTREIPAFDYKLSIERSIRDEFNIITVGRFDFPHKSYILGLIEAYGELKENYNQIKLTIIGYGKDENQVKERIGLLSPKAKKDVKLVGKVPYDSLRKYFEKAHLNIGLAGTIGDGALTGLISIPVRHYSEACEGYGYLPESKGKTTSAEPGTPVQKFIEEVILMSQEEYVELSKMAYDTYAENNGRNILSILECKNRDASKTVDEKLIKFVMIYKILTGIKIRINREICRVIKKKKGRSLIIMSKEIEKS